MILYNEVSPEQLFAKFSGFLIKGNRQQIQKYYDLLKDHYRSYEWYTHIHIPAFKIFKVLEQNKAVSEASLEKIKKIFTQLFMQTTIQLCQLSKQNEMALILVDENLKVSAAVTLFEGLLHSEEIHAVIASKKALSKEFESLINSCKIKKIYVLGDSDESYVNFTNKVDIYSLTEGQLESFLSKMSYVDLQHVKFTSQLEQYKMKSQLADVLAE